MRAATDDVALIPRAMRGSQNVALVFGAPSKRQAPSKRAPNNAAPNNGEPNNPPRKSWYLSAHTTPAPHRRLLVCISEVAQALANTTTSSSSQRASQDRDSREQQMAHSNLGRGSTEEPKPRSSLQAIGMSPNPLRRPCNSRYDSQDMTLEDTKWQAEKGETTTRVMSPKPAILGEWLQRMVKRRRARDARGGRAQGRQSHRNNL